MKSFTKTGSYSAQISSCVSESVFLTLGSDMEEHTDKGRIIIIIIINMALKIS